MEPIDSANESPLIDRVNGRHSRRCATGSPRERHVLLTGIRHQKEKHYMVYLQVTLNLRAERRPAAAEIYHRHKHAFLTTIAGAKSKDLLVRDEDVQVLHGFA